MSEDEPPAKQIKTAKDPEEQDEKRRVDTTEPTDVTTFGGFQIPIEILRKFIEPLDLEDRCQARLCNRALEEAVATSKWRVGRKGVKVENGVNEVKGMLGVQVTIKQRAEGAEVHLYLNEKRLNANWSGRFRLCEMLLTNSMEICGDTYDNEEMNFVSDLLDNCKVNVLHLDLAPRQQLTPRTHSLIAKANKVKIVVNNSHSLNNEEYLSIAKPVEFLGSTKAFDSILAPGNDAVFLELFRRGHEFPHIFSSIITPQTLANVIKIVSDSPERKLLIVTPVAVGEAFVKIANPEKTAADKAWYQFYKRCTMRTYRYQSAEIVYTKVRNPWTRAVKRTASIARFKINMC